MPTDTPDAAAERYRAMRAAPNWVAIKRLYPNAPMRDGSDLDGDEGVRDAIATDAAVLADAYLALRAAGTPDAGAERETMDILADPHAARQLAASEGDIAAGRVHDHKAVREELLASAPAPDPSPAGEDVLERIDPANAWKGQEKVSESLERIRQALSKFRHGYALALHHNDIHCLLASHDRFKAALARAEGELKLQTHEAGIWKNFADRSDKRIAVMADDRDEARQQLAAAEQLATDRRLTLNRICARVGHPPLAPDEGHSASIADRVDTLSADHARLSEVEEHCRESHGGNIQEVHARSHEHHEEHHKREEELTAQLAAAEAKLAEVTKERDDAHDALRSLACWLSVGGYNADKVDAATFERNIRGGVDAIIKVETARARGPRISDTEETALLRRANEEFSAQLSAEREKRRAAEAKLAEALRAMLDAVSDLGDDARAEFHEPAVEAAGAALAQYAAQPAGDRAAGAVGEKP